MFHKLKGGLKNHFADFKVDFIINSTNCYGTPSGEVDKKVNKSFLKALTMNKSEKNMPFGEARLGEYMLCPYKKRYNKPRGIVHLFTHKDVNDKINYAAFKSALLKFCSDAENQQSISQSKPAYPRWNNPKTLQVKIGVPKFMGCESEEDWSTVLEILREAYELYKLIDFYIIEEGGVKSTNPEVTKNARIQ